MADGIAGIEWVECRTRDFNRIVDFYENVLGLNVHFEEDDKEFVQFKVGKSKTYLAVMGTKIQDKTSNFIPAIEVKDVEAVVKKLKNNGVKFISGIVDFTHIRLVELQDPDGNLLQLFQWRK